MPVVVLMTILKLTNSDTIWYGANKHHIKGNCKSDVGVMETFKRHCCIEELLPCSAFSSSSNAGNSQCF